jgi:Thiol-disulfide isomerase and thioredoxins
MKNKFQFILLLIFCPLWLMGQNETDGILEINFPGNIKGNITLFEYVNGGDHLVRFVIDSAKIENGKYVYKYKYREVNTITALCYPKDSIKSVRIYIKNHYFTGTYSDAIALDNHHAIITLDSLFVGKRGTQYRGSISGSPETEINNKILNDWFNPKDQHKFTNPKEGYIDNFDIIKANPNSQTLLKKIYSDRDYYTVDSLKMILYLFDENVQKSSTWGKTKAFIQHRELFTKRGISQKFIFYDIHSQKYTFEKCLNGKPMALIVFWASWCGPCIKEIPHLRELYEKFRDQVVFISLSVDSNKQSWEKAVSEHPVDWLSLASFPESTTKVMDIFNISAVPCFLVVDKSGKLLLDGLKSYAITKKDGVMTTITLNNIDQYFNNQLIIKSNY